MRVLKEPPQALEIPHFRQVVAARFKMFWTQFYSNWPKLAYIPGAIENIALHPTVETLQFTMYDKVVFPYKSRFCLRNDNRYV
ncbi:hypothetical protein TNCV_446951 [Trichonephila clavipes]|nr:hypothetical protein TNCV_446951 [Trichonephila clavipes]